MRDLENLRAAADRIRTAVQSLTDPHDLEIVGQYLQELKDLARLQDPQVGGRHCLEIGSDADWWPPEGGYDVKPELRSTVCPMAGTPLRYGTLTKASASEGYPSKWVLSLDRLGLSDA